MFKITRTAITPLICKLQSFRSVYLDQRDEIYQMSPSRAPYGCSASRAIWRYGGPPGGAGARHAC